MQNITRLRNWDSIVQGDPCIPMIYATLFVTVDIQEKTFYVSTTHESVEKSSTSRQKNTIYPLKWNESAQHDDLSL